MPTVTIFASKIVLLPGETAIFDISSKRQKDLVKACQKSGFPLGIVYKEKESLSRVGCLATIISAHPSKQAKHLELIIKGTLAFEIKQLVPLDSISFEGQIKILENRYDNLVAEEYDRLRLIKYMIMLFQLSGSFLDTSNLNKMQTNDLSYLLSGTKLLSLQQRQTVLESRSCKERLELLIRAVEEALNRYKALSELGKLYQNNKFMRHSMN